MKFKLLFTSILVFFTISVSFSQSRTFFIKYKSNVSKSEIANKISSQQFLPQNLNFELQSEDYNVKYFAKGLGQIDESLSRIVKVQFKNEVDENTFLSVKDIDPDIEYVQVAITYKMDEVPNDSLVSEQWGLEKIKAFDAWNITKGVDTVLIGVIDTGIDYDHPDLKNKLFINPGETGTDQSGNPKESNGIDDDNNGFVDDYRGWDFTDRIGFPFDTLGGDYITWDNNPIDEQGHGTFVSGIIGAESNNRIGVSGVAPNLKMLNLRAFDPIGFGEEDDVSAAILYAIEMGVKVINMSFGDYSFSYVLRDVIRYAYSQNVVMIASAGNSGSSDPHYPSGYSEVISIGNSTEQDYVAGGSNYGSTLDMVAPGTVILSTELGGDYVVSGGTSASAPFVSATAGLILSLQNFTNEEVKQILKSTTDDILEPGWDLKSGAGRLNTFKALSVLAPAQIKINHPFQDFTTNQNELNINATVLSPYFVKFNLQYGPGLNPENWTNLISNYSNQISEEDIYSLDLSNLSEGPYTLRLIVTLNNGSTTEERVNFYVDRTHVDMVIISDGTIYYGNTSTIYGEVATSKRSITRMYYRKKNSGEQFNFITLDGFATNNQFVKQTHYGFVPVDLIESGTAYEIYYEAENLVGLTTVLDNDGQYYTYRTDPAYEQFSANELSFKLPKGTLYPDPVNFISNDFNEVLFNQFYSSDNVYYSLYKLNGDHFQKNETDSIENRLPRYVIDLNNNGKVDLVNTFINHGFIDEQVQPNSFTFENKFADSSGNFFPMIVDDIDKDGSKEIISIYKDTSIAVYKVDENLNATLETVLPNFSSKDSTLFTTNFITQNIVIADINGDGKEEIWFLDFDGDLVNYIVNSPGNYQKGVPVETDFRVRFNSTLQAGDFDGDGFQDLGVLFYSNIIAPFHALLVFNYQNNNFNILYEKSFIDQSAEFGNITFSDVETSIRFDDLDNDFVDELILAIFPYTYIVKHTAFGENEMVYFAQGTNMEKIFVGDLNNNDVNELAIQFDDGIKFFEFTASQKPAAPNLFSGYSIDENNIYLKWQGSAEKYYLYKGEDEQNLVLYDSTSNLNFTDNNVSSGKTYFYKLQAYDSFRPIPLSNFTGIIDIYAHNPAQIVSADAKSNRSILVKFSERVNNTVENLRAFEVLGFEIPNSVSPASQFSYLLSFEENLPAGNNNLLVREITDYYGSPIEQDTIEFNVPEVFENSEFFISSHEIINPYQIRITFNLEVDPTTATNVNNFVFNPDNKATSVSIDSEDPKTIYINLKGKKPVGSIGKEYRLKLENLKSSVSTGNIIINSGAGSFIVLTGFAEDLSDVYVYPNPAKIKNGSGKLMFANLPKRAKITIFNLSGKQLINLEETDGNGGVEFDLRDNSGEYFSSGIYIFRVVRLNDSGDEVEEKIGKFAVIR